MSNRIQVWSCGGGTQSAAIAALICRGDLRPDISVIVDTEREVEQTWLYYETVLVPELAKAGVVLHRVPKSDYATVDLYGGANGDKLLIPALLDGGAGKLPTYCSNEWKARVVQRFCNDRFPGEIGFDIWLGISRDEAHRMKRGSGKWQYKHPLIDDDRFLSRRGCISLVKNMGWPEPPRSRCWMCPNQGASEWKELKENWPADYAMAVAFEKEIQQRDPTVQVLRSKSDQGDCMSGFCFT